jgi:hypothetical protein
MQPIPRVAMASLDYKPSLLEHSMYPPPPPQIIPHPMDDSLHFRTGIRYTGMPAWNKALRDEDIWEVTAFLSRIEKLPPAVQEHWKKTYRVSFENHQMKSTKATIKPHEVVFGQVAGVVSDQGR